MKNRTETKESIHKKAAEALTARARRRKTVMSAAACVMLTFVTAVAFWLQARERAAEDKGQSVKMGEVSTGDKEYCTNSDGVTQWATGINEPKGDVKCLYGTYNSSCLEAEIIVYTKPASEMVKLNEKNSKQRKYIERINQWISELETEPTISSGDNSDVTYVIKRNCGEELNVVYVNGSNIKFDNGKWLEFSESDREEFENIMREILDAD